MGATPHDVATSTVRLLVAFTRAPLRLPGNGRMIVWTVVNIEEWEITRPMATALAAADGPDPDPRHAELDLYEYGMRVGFWRLMRALEQAKVTPTMSLNAKVCETTCGVAAAAPTPAGVHGGTAACRCRSSRSRTSAR